MQADASSTPPATDEIRLAEFVALRQEIAQRSSFQHGLMVLNLTVVGAVIGLVFGHDGDRALLLIVPVVGPALGILWFGNHVAIVRIGTYIATKLWLWTPSWEIWLAECEPTEHHWWNQTWWPTVQLLFCGVPVTILATGPPSHVNTFADWALWSAGLIVTGYLVIASSLLRRLSRPGGASDSPAPGGESASAG
jgi:hypothetical protein